VGDPSLTAISQYHADPRGEPSLILKPILTAEHMCIPARVLYMNLMVYTWHIHSLTHDLK